ncbi:hypothetical protein BGZ47_002850, partial [Haplosporangium gracile]
MSNPSNISPPGNERFANRELTPSLTTHGRPVSHGTATVSFQQVNLSSNGDDKSISSQGARKRDIFLTFFRSLKSEAKAKTQAATPETRTHHARDVNTVAKNGSNNSGSTINVANTTTGTEFTINLATAYSNIFSENLSRPSSGIALPKPGERIDTTPQLVLCNSLLLQIPALSMRSNLGLEKGQKKEVSMEIPMDSAHRDWVKDISQNHVEQDHIRWLLTRMVEEFVKDAIKGSSAIKEVVLLGPVLDREHYRNLLSCFIVKFDQSVILDVDLLHGLVQIVQCASEGYLVEDDLVKIMSILRTRLQDTHKPSSEHPCHLTLALSRILDVMAKHEVKDVNRVEHHEPLAAVLNGLRESSDPFLMYQALYAFQALQCIPDDETVLQALMRHSGAVAEGLVNISGVINLNLSGFLEGLGQVQKTIVNSIGIAKATYEGARSLIESGQDVFKAIKGGINSGNKRAWYTAIVGADALIREGRLADFKVVVLEAACRKSHEFQWGICQLLGQIALDPMWDNAIREQAV